MTDATLPATATCPGAKKDDISWEKDEPGIRTLVSWSELIETKDVMSYIRYVTDYSLTPIWLYI